MTTIAVIAVFAVFAGAMVARRLPALLAVPAMGMGMALAAGVPAHELGAIITGGATALAPLLATVVFGATLARVILDTGIARTLVHAVAEYAGDAPFAVALVLCAATAMLFVSLAGLGAVVMVGSIVLPIMLTVGIPRPVAATAFLMAFALGFIFNIVNWTFYVSFFGVQPHQLARFADILAALDAVALVLYLAVSLARRRGYATWIVAADLDDVAAQRPERVPWYALLTPVAPIAGYFGFHLDPMPAFAAAACYGALAATPRAAVRSLTAAAIRGVEDVAPAILLFIGIGILLAATREPQMVAALRPIARAIPLYRPEAYVALFGLASPLALYRGPLNPFGAGIAFFTALLSVHVVSPVLLVAGIMCVVQVQNVCDPTNTANVWVSTFTGTSLRDIMRLTLPWQAAVAVLGALAATIAIRPAAAATLPPRTAEFPNLYAPPAHAYRIAVGARGGELDAVAADAVASVLADFDGLHVVRLDARDDIFPCTQVPYVAYVRVWTTAFRMIAGTDFDVGVALDDCGGWNVGEWHDHRVVPGAPEAADAAALARDGARRLEAWALAHRERARHLWTKGLAYALDQASTYYYALFKTVDGNLRAFVRVGGPAYDAGLRTGDVVEKIDGRWWWDYGTYQSELRAYDGLPHAFEIERDGRVLDVQLGKPFVPLRGGE